MAMVILSPSVERFSVSRMLDFFLPFGLGGAINIAEEEDELVND